jgi:nicotinamide mononucleotide (NMN) deamidase PncC
MAPRRITLALDVSEKFAAKMAFSKRLADLAERTLDAAKAKDWSVVTAESCTAGKLAALLSEAPGASERLQ